MNKNTNIGGFILKKVTVMALCLTIASSVSVFAAELPIEKHGVIGMEYGHRRIKELLL